MKKMKKIAKNPVAIVSIVDIRSTLHVFAVL